MIYSFYIGTNPNQHVVTYYNVRRTLLPGRRTQSVSSMEGVALEKINK